MLLQVPIKEVIDKTSAIMQLNLYGAIKPAIMLLKVCNNKNNLKIGFFLSN